MKISNLRHIQQDISLQESFINFRINVNPLLSLGDKQRHKVFGNQPQNGLIPCQAPLNRDWTRQKRRWKFGTS